MIKNFRLFESLGIADNILHLAEDIKIRLQKEKRFILKTIIREVNVELRVYKKNYKSFNSNMLENVARIWIIDSKNWIFGLEFTDNNLPSIIHELKHLDNYIVRNINIEHEFFVKRSIQEIISNYKFLFKSSDLLYSIVEIINKSEFESYYNELYVNLTEKINDNMTNEEKKEIIKNSLNDNIHYVFSKGVFEYGFDIKKFFKNNRNLNIFIEMLIKIINKKKQYELTDHTQWNKIKLMIKSFLTFSDDKNIYNKKCNEINNIINKNAERSYKKFHRLYSIFIK